MRLTHLHTMKGRGSGSCVHTSSGRQEIRIDQVMSWHAAAVTDAAESTKGVMWATMRLPRFEALPVRSPYPPRPAPDSATFKHDPLFLQLMSNASETSQCGGNSNHNVVNVCFMIYINKSHVLWCVCCLERRIRLQLVAKRRIERKTHVPSFRLDNLFFLFHYISVTNELTNKNDTRAVRSDDEQREEGNCILSTN